MVTLNNIYNETHGTSHFMVLDLQSESDIESLGYGMLSNNDIEGVLNISTSHFNDVYQLRYDVTQYKKMSTLLNQRVKWSFVTQAISEILRTLLEAEDYLLDADKFILDPNYIYIHNLRNTLELAYMPLVNAEFESFDVFKLAKYILNNSVIEEDAGVPLSKVLNFLNSGSHKSFLEFLNLIETSHEPVRRAPSQVAPPKVKDQPKVKSLVVEEKPVVEESAKGNGLFGKKNVDIPNLKVPSFGKGKVKACLTRVKNNEEIEINKDTFKIGNNPQKCHYSCPSNSAISRSHADIVKHKNDYFLMDHGSTNKTYLNNEVLTPKKQYILNHNDIIKFANEAFKFEITQ